MSAHVRRFFTMTCSAINMILSKIILQITTSMSMQNAVHNLPLCLVKLCKYRRHNGPFSNQPTAVEDGPGTFHCKQPAAKQEISAYVC